MTKKEIEKTKWAIEQLMDHDSGDFMGAITILCRLVGWEYPAGEYMEKIRNDPNIQTKTLTEILQEVGEKGLPCEFSPNLPE